MSKTSSQSLLRSTARLAYIAALGVLLSLTQTGCVMVGYSSRGGWFLWPGGLGLVLMALLWLLFNFLRRGR